jgi:choice-of-anchor A domain-containing protein/uncharacterized repeat protein (TIGR01451 family)
MIAALLAAGLPAAAAPTFNPVAGNLGFDVMIRGNATLIANESEGPVAIGGNLTIGGPRYGVNIHNFPVTVPGLTSASNPIGLLVAGGVNWGASAANGMTEVLNGKIKIGNLTGSSVYGPDTVPPSGDGLTHITAAGAGSGATPQVKSDDHTQAGATVGLLPGETLPNFTSTFATFAARSIGLGQCASNVPLLDPNTGLPLVPQAIPPDGRVSIRLTPGVQNVLNLTAAQFASIREMTFLNTPSATTPLVVNVSGSSVTWPNMNTPPLGLAEAPYILWNFPDASLVTRTQGDSVQGTIYAPRADFINTDPLNVQGDIIAATLDRDGGEYHHAPFNATLTACGATPTDSLDMTKSVTPSTVAKAGATVTYSFTVTNTGTGTVSGISIAEDFFTGHGAISAPSCPVTTLAAGASTTCTATYTLDQADIDNGYVANTAHAAGTGPSGPVSSPTASAVVMVGKVKSLTMVKSASPATVNAAGDRVTYRFLVTNTGNQTVSKVFIDEVAFSGTGAAPAISCPATRLLPRASTTCTATYTITATDVRAGKVTNTAHAVGKEPDGTTVLSPDDTATVRVKPVLVFVPVTG